MKNRICEVVLQTQTNFRRRCLHFTIVILSILFCGGSIRAAESKAAALTTVSIKNQENFQRPKCAKKETNESQKVLSKIISPDAGKPELKPLKSSETGSSKEDYEKTQTTASEQESADKSAAVKQKFHWQPALMESGMLLGIQHSFRLMQKRTTNELGGPFFRDWGNSVKNLRGWKDGDIKFINYVAHPLQGGATGRIFINNSDRAKKQEFGKSKQYWESRLKAMAWSAVWSTQFELGPLSEASIGNVGLRSTDRHQMAWVDLIITPTLGTGVIIEEDLIDKYVLKNWLERKTGNQVTTKIKILRSVLTPTTAFSNLLGGKAPWKRHTR